MRNDLSLGTKCSLLFASYYAFMYPTMIMYSTYLVTFGLDVSIVAVMMSISGMISLVLRPILAPVIDGGKCRTLSLIMIGCMAVGVIVFFFPGNKSFLQASVYAVLTNSVCVCFMDMNDSWVLKLVKQTCEVDYGRSRAFGSAAFAVTGLLYGYAFSKLGSRIAPVCILTLMLFLFLVTRVLPDPQKVEVVGNRRSGISNYKTLVKNRKIIAFVICYALANATFNFTDNYIPVLILQRGGSTAWTGLNDFVMATIEFLVLRRFTEIADRIGTERVVWMGMLGFCVKAVLVALMPSPVWILIACLTQVISFCLMIPSRMRFIEKNVMQDEIAVVMSLSSFASSAFSTFVSNPLASQLIPRIGTDRTMILYGCLAAVAGICFATIMRILKPKKQMIE